jgi:glutamate synthase domain-containing protein 1
MCGIAGYIARTGRQEDVGRTVLAMLGGLARRGPDSAGVALFRSEPAVDDICWLRLPVDVAVADAEVLVRARLDRVADVRAVEAHPGLLRLELAGRPEPNAVRGALERPEEDYEVVSLGRSMELIKQVGHPDGLEASFGIAGFQGSHGIGHTRLSTESRVDLSHSQPFWARGVSDLATVHNGHITNYHKLRRTYEQRGVRFFTENDSEVIGVYLADQLDRGLSLDDALAASLDEFDGSFTYLVATPDALGFARDPFALKPLITVETPDYVAIANEELAIRAALGPAGVAHEPTGHVFRLWRRTPLATPVAA